MTAIRDRIKELVRVRAGDLAPNPKNWRRHPAKQEAAMRGVLAELGYADALLARETAEGLMLIDGHLRASLDPEQTVPVLVLDVDEAEADYLLATLDPLAAMAERDGDMVAELLTDVRTGQDAVRDLLESVGGAQPDVGLTDEDAAPDVPATAASQRGEVWALGEHRLMCGDSTDSGDVTRLMAGDLVAVLFTDPPYGVGYDHAATGRARPKFDTIINDELQAPALEVFFREFLEAAQPLLVGDGVLYVCAANKTSHVFVAAAVAAGVHLAVPIVWVKQSFALNWDRYHPQHEMIFYGGPGSVPTGANSRWHGPKNETTVWQISRDAHRTYRHPTQKPVALAERAIVNSSAAGELIYDPFLGSGSTMIAAERLGRRCYAMEIDPFYVDVAIQRWESFTGEKARLECNIAPGAIACFR